LRLLARLLSPIALVACAMPSPASAASLTRGPFLQQTGPTSTIVVARTDVAAQVRAVAELPGGGTVEAATAGTEHVLRLQGLPPSSAVRYRVEVDGTERSSGVVHTPGRPGTAAGRRAVLGVIGDHGTAGPIAAANGERMRERGVEAVLTVGDNAYPDGAAGDWDPAMFRPFAALLRNATLFSVPGDHEYRTPWGQGYYDAHVLPEGPEGERYYSFDWGDLHVVALDSNCIVPMVAAEAGCTTASMTAWLRQDLAASTAPWTVALIHRPAVATGKYGVYPQVPDALVPIFQEFAVDVVFQGHNHLYERTWPTKDGKPVQKNYDHPTAPVYMTTGGGGDWLYDFALPAAEWTAYREKTDEHVVLTLEEGTMKIESIRSNGTVHDQFTIVKDVPPLPVSPPSEPPPLSDSPTPPGGGDATPVDASQAGCASGGSAGVLTLTVLGIALLALARRRVPAAAPAPAPRARRRRHR
jgi:hypothetical protein